MSNTELYPLKFKPILKPTIWGGKKLGAILDKPISSLETCGESWEISDVSGDETKVLDGSLKGHTLGELINKYKGALVGDIVYNVFGENFPLLVKFIDAKTPLSIQVHPGDAMAKERHNSFGKNEMWYVMQADDEATALALCAKCPHITSMGGTIEIAPIMEM